MDSTAVVDDNFFIEEPRSLIKQLKIKFFDPNSTPDKQMVDLLAKKHLDTTTTTSPTTDRIKQLNRIQTCRLAYNKKLKLFQQEQYATMPRSFITRLESLCQETYTTGDINIAQQAVDTLICASKSGCCFLERYIVMLLNFCTKKHDETMKIKVDELLNRVLIVDFDRQQLIENLRRPEYKITSVDHIIQLLLRVQDMLDYREHESVAINWLLVMLDAYFVEIATTDEVVDIIDKISKHIDSKCALMREKQSTKCLLDSILEDLENNDKNNNNNNINHKATTPDPSSFNLIGKKSTRQKRPHYSIEFIEF